MVIISCPSCEKVFTQKGHFDKHLARKTPCKKNTQLGQLIEHKVQEALISAGIISPVIFPPVISPPVIDKTAKMIRDVGLDQFYTNPDVAKQCLTTIETKFPWNSWKYVVEPSAGNGSFYTQIPFSNKIGIDISPEHESIIKMNFFDYSPSDTSNILVVGNPPFGRVCSLAIDFFNHSAKWCSVIAFIIPKTFRRISIQNRLDLGFHLVHDNDIPSDPCSFTPPMMVKCCFQIWEKRSTQRSIIKLETTHNDWTFLSFGPLDDKNQPTPPTGADFAILAYGGKCGRIVTTGLSQLRPKSWHWIKANINQDELIRRFNTLDYSIGNDTARQNSMGRGELVKIYTEQYYM